MASKPRRIMYDGFNMGLETGTGVATYARNLTFCAHEIGYDIDVLYGVRTPPSKDDLMREVAFFDPEAPPPALPVRFLNYTLEALTAALGVAATPVPVTGKVVSSHYRSRLPYFDNLWNAPDIFRRSERFLFSNQWLNAARLTVRPPITPDIAHWTYPLPLRVPNALNIYTMHDLVPLRLPFTTLDNKGYYLALSRLLALRADHIVTVSEASKRDIVNLLGVPEDKVTNTYQAVEIPARYADKPDDVVKREVEGTIDVKYKEYMLFFGAIEPKKNVGRLIEAYLSAKIDTPLVIVGKLAWAGKFAWKVERELTLIEEDAVAYLEHVGRLTYTRRKVYQIDYAPFPLLVSLIKGAKAVLFPSLYEGFGLPILEAMKLGTPVLTSTEGSTPEVAADGALIVDPYDVRAITDGIVALDSNPELRGALAARGRKRADIFSHAAYARRVDELYSRLLKDRPRMTSAEAADGFRRAEAARPDQDAEALGADV